ncbi:rubredoxin [Cocleimonas flava]|uniref:Rubredoxin n=2 Tax=Thiotrichaceae TaxID=135617 RepID=A0A4R1F891_9GAMM|nr:rubredoxin [Cocleimonas flava]
MLKNYSKEIDEIKTMKSYMCIVCGLVYEEEQGWPEDGIAPGTKWEDVPENWECPDCGVGKSEFEMIEI